MSKRSKQLEGQGRKRHTARAAERTQAQELEFEDPFGDEFESESDEEMHDTSVSSSSASNASNMVVSSASATNTMMEDESEEGKNAHNVMVFRPGIDKLKEGEELQYSSDAYVMYHSMTAEWPSLSIDVVPDRMGPGRTKFPLTAYFVAGSQADKPQNNSLQVIKLSDLQRTKNDDDSDMSDDDADDDCILEYQKIPHPGGGINRVRVMPQQPNVVAAWGDNGIVSLYDIRPQLATLDTGVKSGGFPSFSGNGAKNEAVYTFTGHATEGFAMDWSHVTPGRLATGDCSKYIYVWDAVAGAPVATVGRSNVRGVPLPDGSSGTWKVSKMPFNGHSSSVEDLQWSPTESTVFASCGVDQSVRIWDIRDASKSQLSVHAAESDINVISWNAQVGFLLVSGADDGGFKIWDLRKFQADSPLAHFRYHSAPITSIQWDPCDENVIAAAAADDSLSIWDMSLEADTEAAMSGEITSSTSEGVADLPPQLLFVHSGQNDIKELRFHAQLPGVVLTTAGSGFNIFKPDVQL